MSISRSSLKSILLSTNWNWIGNIISKEILNLNKLEDITIENDQISIKGVKENNTDNEIEKLEIKLNNGKIYLENKTHTKSVKLPIENKVHVRDLKIQSNSIIIYAESHVSF